MNMKHMSYVGIAALLAACSSEIELGLKDISDDTAVQAELAVNSALSLGEVQFLARYDGSDLNLTEDCIGDVCDVPPGDADPVDDVADNGDGDDSENGDGGDVADPGEGGQGGGLEADYCMVLSTDRVTAAWVSLNDDDVFAPRAFKRSVEKLVAPINVLPDENLISVRIAGKPGVSMVVSVYKNCGLENEELVTEFQVTRKTGAPQEAEEEF